MNPQAHRALVLRAKEDVANSVRPSMDVNGTSCGGRTWAGRLGLTRRTGRAWIAQPGGGGIRSCFNRRAEEVRVSTRRPVGAKASPDAERKPHEGSEDPIVVGVGASAGGLAAFSRLLAGLPEHTGLAFVLLQHLDPKHPSLLTQLLSTRTSMPVAEATEGVRVAADHVYLAPAAMDLLIEGAHLRLTARDEDGHLHLPIDRFLRSLAADAGERCIGVVLSGAASDGVQGLAAIKSSGGMTFAQDPSSAEYSSMPSSAIAARVVDFVLSPEEIAMELVRLGAGVDAGGAALSSPDSGGEDAVLGEVFALLRGAFGVDFSAYKLPTIRRRIGRRMLVRRAVSLEEYVDLMTEDPGEVEALYATS
jgi:two-component system CheB/CheR fusion protein